MEYHGLTYILKGYLWLLYGEKTAGNQEEQLETVESSHARDDCDLDKVAVVE